MWTDKRSLSACATGWQVRIVYTRDSLNIDVDNDNLKKFELNLWRVFDMGLGTKSKFLEKVYPRTVAKSQLMFNVLTLSNSDTAQRKEANSFWRAKIMVADMSSRKTSSELFLQFRRRIGGLTEQMKNDDCTQWLVKWPKSQQQFADFKSDQQTARPEFTIRRTVPRVNACRLAWFNHNKWICHNCESLTSVVLLSAFSQHGRCQSCSTCRPSTSVKMIVHRVSQVKQVMQTLLWSDRDKLSNMWLCMFPESASLQPSQTMRLVTTCRSLTFRRRVSVTEWCWNLCDASSHASGVDGLKRSCGRLSRISVNRFLKKQGFIQRPKKSSSLHSDREHTSPKPRRVWSVFVSLSLILEAQMVIPMTKEAW